MNQTARVLLGILLFTFSSSASAGWMSFFSSSDWQNNPVPVFGPLTVNTVADQDLQPGDDNDGFARFLIQNFTVPSDQVTYALQVQNHGARGVMIALHGANDPGKWRHPFNFFHFSSATLAALFLGAEGVAGLAAATAFDLIYTATTAPVSSPLDFANGLKGTANSGRSCPLKR